MSAFPKVEDVLHSPDTSPHLSFHLLPSPDYSPHFHPPSSPYRWGSNPVPHALIPRWPAQPLSRSGRSALGISICADCHSQISLSPQFLIQPQTQNGNTMQAHMAPPAHIPNQRPIFNIVIWKRKSNTEPQYYSHSAKTLHPSTHILLTILPNLMLNLFCVEQCKLLTLSQSTTSHITPMHK